MGKRKLHDATYYQCDWTGLPMRSSNCYMPTWTNGKFTKRGSYGNWESVVAHAHNLLTKGVITVDTYNDTLEHINQVVGVVIKAAPMWWELKWLSATGVIQDAQQFQDRCESDAAPVFAIRLMPDNSAHEVLCSAHDKLKESDFYRFLTKPFYAAIDAKPTSFLAVRKKSFKDRELVVIYWPDKNGLPLNTAATTMFKMQIHGDVLLVQQTKENCFVPRTRFVNYYLSNYEEQYKKKKVDAPAPISTGDYDAIKAELKGSLSVAEELVSSSAVLPGELAKAANILPPQGSELASLMDPSGLVRELMKM